MSIIDALGSIYESAIRTTCSGEENCVLRLDGYNNYIILKGEDVRESSEEICDHLVFINETIEELVIAIIEFKTNNVHVDKVAKQIENGSMRAVLILKRGSEICFDEELKCLDNKILCHIAVARHWNTTQRKMLIRRKIMVNGRSYYIRPKECGDLLKDVLSQR